MIGKFIVVDGIDGAGKSTALQAVANFLNTRGIPYILTREPGGTPLAEEIRNVALTERDEPVDDYAELLMMFASRAQHLKTRIMPALQRGQWVLCDRFTSTTKAYQGYARGISLKHINTLENMVQGNLRPDMTFILDLDPNIGKARTTQRGDENRLDKETHDFMSKVREGMLTQARQDPNRFGVINADQSPEAVAQDLALFMEDLMSVGCDYPEALIQ